MSAESLGPDDGGPDPDRCRNAKEFALKALEEAEEPVRPVDLAERYDCTKGHMRDMLRQLRKAGRAERIAPGQYVRSNGEETESGEDAAEMAMATDRAEATGTVGEMASGTDSGETTEPPQTVASGTDPEQQGGSEASGNEGNGQSGGGAQSQGTDMMRTSPDGNDNGQETGQSRRLDEDRARGQNGGVGSVPPEDARHEEERAPDRERETGRNGGPIEVESRLREPATKEEMMDVEDRTADLEEAVGGVQRCMTEMAGSEDQEREVKDLMGIFDEGGQDGDQEERDGSEDDEESEDSDQIGEQQNGGGSGMVTQDAYERQQQRLDFRGRVDEEADEEGEEEPMPGIPRSLAMAGVGLALLVILWRLRSSKKNTQNGQNGQSESGQDEEKDVPLIER